MSIDQQRREILEARALEAVRERIAQEHYLTVTEVCKAKHLSRAVVEALPVEILPYTDYGRGSRMHRRYHPADVLALDARMRRWTRAKAEGAGEAYLAELRAELEATDTAAIRAAHEARRAVA